MTDPKTRKGWAPVPVIRQLADRLEMRRLRSGNPDAGPIFANSLGKPMSLGSVVNRVIFPALNQCEVCGKTDSDHRKAGHPYKRELASLSGTAGTRHAGDLGAISTASECQTW
jgi:hypothetical protein